MDRYGSSFEWYPPPSKPRPADGLRARSQRGAIGDTWWSKHFIDVLESFHMGTRLTRGRSYARAGQVLKLEVASGEVTSSVQGSRVKPYEVSIRLLPLSEKDWAKVVQVMEERAVFLAKLLAGDMPHDIEEVFSTCRLSLFPESLRDLSTDCSCPDWANPCKHIAATFYLLAEAFDGDPFLIFQWRGRTKQELLSRLVTRGGGAQTQSGDGRDATNDGGGAGTGGADGMGGDIQLRGDIGSSSGGAKAARTSRISRAGMPGISGTGATSEGSDTVRRSRSSYVSIGSGMAGMSGTTRPSGTAAASSTGLPGKQPAAAWPVPVSVDPAPLDECIDSFYECVRDFAGVNFSTQEEVRHDAILNELGDLPFDLDGIPVTDLLRPAYDAMARAVEDYIARSTPGI